MPVAPATRDMVIVNSLPLQARPRTALPYADRSSAGRMLAGRLDRYCAGDDTVVVALPRGGAPVAVAVSQALELPLGCLLVQKVRLPARNVPVGAVSEGDILVWNERLSSRFHRANPAIGRAVAQARQALQRRQAAYSALPAMSVEGRRVILVDDGLESGVTLRAAAGASRARGAGEIVAAVPVGHPDIGRLLGDDCDEIVCVASPQPFHDIGQAYLDFHVVTDDEAMAMIGQ